MQTSIPIRPASLALPACLALLLSLGGCFGGEDAKDNPVGPRGPGPGPGDDAGRIRPGLYAGDYTPYPSAEILGGRLDSEFLIGADGTYRFFWFIDNTPIYDFRGDWSQRDSNLYFAGISESVIDGGIFYPAIPVEDDTNAVRDVTEDSFARKEWSLLRQKPLWITYRRIAPESRLANGSFGITKEYFRVDSASAIEDRIDVRLDGTEFEEDFVRSYLGDTLLAYQGGGSWSQVGSVFIVDGFTSRSYDTASHAFREERDSIPGAILQRVRDVSDTAFSLWSPSGSGGWDRYRKE